MKKDRPDHRRIRFPDILYSDIQFIAEKEKRNATEQILYFLENSVSKYFRENPDIKESRDATFEALHRTLSKTLAASSSDTRMGPLTKLSILCVEDNPIQQNLMKLIFDKLGHNLECVFSGEEALKKIINNSYDGFIIDVLLDDGIDGKELTQKLIEKYSDLKYIVLTGDKQLQTKKVFRDILITPMMYLEKSKNNPSVIREWLQELENLKK